MSLQLEMMCHVPNKAENATPIQNCASGLTFLKAGGVTDWGGMG
jgi:hypothetical protein